MGRRNITFNRLLRRVDFFADCFNAVVPQARLSGERLRNTDSKLMEKNSAYEKYSDSRKLLVNEAGEPGAVLTIENQNMIDPSMAVRNHIYDVYTYECQLDEIRHLHKVKKDLKKNEYIACFGNGDRLLPSVTLVVYIGREPWSGCINLHEVVDFEKVPPENREAIMELCNDARFLVLDVRHVSEKVFAEMKTDLKHLFMMIRQTESKAGLVAYVAKHATELKNLDEDVYRAIASVCNIRELNDLIPASNEPSGHVNMSIWRMPRGSTIPQLCCGVVD